MLLLEVVVIREEVTEEVRQVHPVRQVGAYAPPSLRWMGVLMICKI